MLSLLYVFFLSFDRLIAWFCEWARLACLDIWHIFSWLLVFQLTISSLLAYGEWDCDKCCFLLKLDIWSDWCQLKCLPNLFPLTLIPLALWDIVCQQMCVCLTVIRFKNFPGLPAFSFHKSEMGWSMLFEYKLGIWGIHCSLAGAGLYAYLIFFPPI